MVYLIDGHNLIGQLPDISLDDPNDEALLVQRLYGFAARTRARIHVVFDHGVPGGVSRMSNSKVKVIFAPAGTPADTVIARRIRTARNPRDWIVVSSDREVLAMARRFRMTAVAAMDFARQMQQPAAPPPPGRDVAANPVVSPDEVDEFLRLFDGQN